jgi:hypothetical protein
VFLNKQSPRFGKKIRFMKKKKHKAILKEQKKFAKKELATKLIAGLSATMASFGGNTKKIERLLEKTAKQLAKKLSKEVTTPSTETQAPPSPVVTEKTTKKSIPGPKISAKKEGSPA